MARKKRKYAKSAGIRIGKKEAENGSSVLCLLIFGAGRYAEMYKNNVVYNFFEKFAKSIYKCDKVVVQ